jgi:hypothetical protein
MPTPFWVPIAFVGPCWFGTTRGLPAVSTAARNQAQRRGCMTHTLGSMNRADCTVWIAPASFEYSSPTVGVASV